MKERYANLHAIVIGAGFITGTADYLEEKGVHIAATVVNSEVRATQMSERYGGKPYTDPFTALNEQRKIYPEEHNNLIVVSGVPPSLTVPIAKRYTEAGVHGMYLKPFGSGYDLDEAREVAALAKQKELTTALSYQWDYFPDRVTDKIAETNQEFPVRELLGTWRGPKAPGEWWSKEKMSGGQLNEQATHVTRFIDRNFGPVEVVGSDSFRYPENDYSDQTIADGTVIYLNLKNGAEGAVSAFNGKKDGYEVFVQTRHEGGRLITVTRGTATFEGAGKKEEIDFTQEYKNGQSRLMDDFLEGVVTNNPELPRCDLSQGIRLQEIIYESQQQMQKPAHQHIMERGREPDVFTKPLAA